MGLRTERTELDGTGNVQPTGRTNDWDVTAIYRAVGYLSDNLPQILLDHAAGVILQRGRPHLRRRCAPRGLYTTGWVKRGPSA